MEIYEHEILPDTDTTKIKVEIIEEKSELPANLPFGYIFIPKGQEELIWNTLITCLPMACSLKKVRVLFDQNLRESLFDVLSYQLGLKLNKQEVAVYFRDASIAKHKDDYEAMEKIYADGKLTTIILMEASMRFHKTNGNVTVSDVEEFSRLVRKIAQIDATVIRVGKKYISPDELFEKRHNVILLARGKHISKAVVIANTLKEKGCELYSQQELGFSNPEIGTWYFEGEKSGEKSYLRIWIKWKQA